MATPHGSEDHLKVYLERGRKRQNYPVVYFGAQVVVFFTTGSSRRACSASGSCGTCASGGVTCVSWCRIWCNFDGMMMTKLFWAHATRKVHESGATHTCQRFAREKLSLWRVSCLHPPVGYVEISYRVPEKLEKSELCKQVTTNSMSIFCLMTTTPIAVSVPAKCTAAATKSLSSKNKGCVWVMQQVSLCLACLGGLLLKQKVAVVLAAVSQVGCASRIVDPVVPRPIFF